MTARRKLPMTPAEFRGHAARMRKMGCSRVVVSEDGASYECEWPGLPEERAAAIGFTSGAESDGYDYDETDRLGRR